VDTAPQARFYYSDLFATYSTLVYRPGLHTPMPDKSETYRVEGDNAELRRAVKLFVFAWNRRQLYRHQYPKYSAHLINFVCP
jgi:hypothetical protein